jgi:hypothetical protein
MKLNIEFDLKEDWEHINPILHKNMPRFSKARVTITSEGIKYRQKDFDDVDEAIRETKYDTLSVITYIENYMQENATELQKRLSENSGGNGIPANEWRNY